MWVEQCVGQEIELLAGETLKEIAPLAGKLQVGTQGLPPLDSNLVWNEDKTTNIPLLVGRSPRQRREWERVLLLSALGINEWNESLLPLTLASSKQIMHPGLSLL